MESVKSSKNNSFFNRPMSLKAFWFLVISIGISIFILFSFKCFDSDMYFMIPTGDYILDHGIPHTNAWTIDRSSGFVAQQWLYDVILAWLNSIEHMALWAFVLIQVAIFDCLLWYMCKLYKMSNAMAFLCIMLANIFGVAYLFNIRPQTATLILLLMECIGLEKYKSSGNWKHLLLLPLSMVLEMNLHMSMWPLHYAFLAAYLCPSFYYRKATQNNISIKNKAVIAVIFMMTAVLFVNPYGLNGVLYLFKSLTSGAFDYIEIVEVQHTVFISNAGLIVGVVVLCTPILCKLKAMTSVSLNMIVGITCLMAMTIRNVVYIPILVFYLFVSVAECIKQKQLVINWKKDVTRIFYLILIPVFAYLGYCTYTKVYSVSANADNLHAMCIPYWTEIETITNHIDANTDDKSIHIFTTVNSGNYLEYKGFDNVYIDARPELYTAVFTGDKDIAQDYRAYAVDGTRVNLNAISKNFTHDYNARRTTDAEMKQWLDEYDFEYLIVDMSVSYLAGYLSGSDDYELIEFNVPLTGYSLYHRIN